MKLLDLSVLESQPSQLCHSVQKEIGGAGAYMPRRISFIGIEMQVFLEIEMVEFFVILGQRFKCRREVRLCSDDPIVTGFAEAGVSYPFRRCGGTVVTPPVPSQRITF